MDADALVAQEYTRMAVVYEERVVARFEPIARRTVGLAQLRPGERVLDVGCGTGLATFLAAGAVGPRGEVVGIDLSEGQLGVATGKAALRRAANVRFQRGDAAKLPPGEGFDAAVSNLGVPPDAAPVLAGARRALRPGARLSMSAWDEGRTASFEDFRAILAEHRVADPPPEVAASRDLIAKRGSRRAGWGTPDGARRLLADLGWRDVRVEPAAYEVRFADWRDLRDFQLAWGWTEAEVRAMPGPGREAFHAHLEARFGRAPFTDTWHLFHATAVA